MKVEVAHLSIFDLDMHAQEFMSKFNLTYEVAEPQPIGDCWIFHNVVGTPGDFKSAFEYKNKYGCVFTKVVKENDEKMKVEKRQDLYMNDYDEEIQIGSNLNIELYSSSEDDCLCCDEYIVKVNDNVLYSINDIVKLRNKLNEFIEIVKK